jgi:hypothetical protein
MDTIVARLLFIEQNLMMLNGFLSHFNVKDFTVKLVIRLPSREYFKNGESTTNSLFFKNGESTTNSLLFQKMLSVLELISQTLHLLSMSKHPNH